MDKSEAHGIFVVLFRKRAGGVGRGEVFVRCPPTPPLALTPFLFFRRAGVPFYRSPSVHITRMCDDWRPIADLDPHPGPF